MTASADAVRLIKRFEGLRLKAYKDAAVPPVWTVGYGLTLLPSGERVKEGDELTMELADKYLMWQIGLKSAAVSGLKIKDLNQHQHDALVDFCFNVGVGAMTKSTLIKLCRLDVNDPAIKDEFMKWIIVGGKPNAWQRSRRAAECELYFTKTI
jgi:lysozyme